MEHLTAEHLAALREKLVVEGAALGQRIKRARLDPPSRDGDAADRMAFDRDTDMLWQFEEQGRDRLLGVGEALQRMDEGTYGVCELCSTGIPVARLLAVPAAKRCAACQQEAERWDRTETHALAGRPLLPVGDAQVPGRRR